jgi:hypothetical protein
MSNEHVHPTMQQALGTLAGACAAHNASKAVSALDQAREIIATDKKRIRELESANANLRAHVRHLNSIIDDIAPTDYAMVLEGDIEQTPIPQEVMIPAIAELMLDIDVRLKLEKIVEHKYMQYVRRLNDDADQGEE